MVAAGRARGPGSGSDDDDDEEKEVEGRGEQRQECHLERQPLLVAREDRRWTMDGFLELFSFNYGTI